MSLGVQIAIILAVILIIAAVLHFSTAIGMQMAISVAVIAAIGILTHFIGEALPRSWFHLEVFPYRECKWEQHGKFYDRFHIRAWKDHMPDKSKWVKGAFKKSLQNQADEKSLTHLLQETCVAECVHWVLLLLSPVVLLFTRGAAATVITILYGLSNLPFVMIQRYNRPRLRSLLLRMQRGTGKECDAT